MDYRINLYSSFEIPSTVIFSIIKLMCLSKVLYIFTAHQKLSVLLNRFRKILKYEIFFVISHKVNYGHACVVNLIKNTKCSAAIVHTVGQFS